MDQPRWGGILSSCAHELHQHGLWTEATDPTYDDHLKVLLLAVFTFVYHFVCLAAVSLTLFSSIHISSYLHSRKDKKKVA